MNNSDIGIVCLDEYTLRNIAAILHAQGIARYIDSRFSTAVDEWADIRALRASCKYFAHAIGVPRLLSEHAQIYRDRAHLSRILCHIFREHFSARSLAVYLSSLAPSQECMAQVIEMGSRLDRVMRECAMRPGITWRIVLDAILREFERPYFTNAELPEGRHEWSYGTKTFDDVVILFDDNTLSPHVNFLLIQIIGKIFGPSNDSVRNQGR